MRCGLLKTGKTHEAVLGREHQLPLASEAAPTPHRAAGAIGRIQLQRLPGGLLFALVMLFCSRKPGRLTCCSCALPPNLTTLGTSFMPSWSPMFWPTFAAMITSCRRSQQSVIPLYPEAVARSTWKNAFRMLAWRPPSVCLWPGSSVRPV